MSTCANCGRALTKPALGRPQSKFCSRKCKDEYRTKVEAENRQRRLAGRICASCSGPIPEGRNSRALTCSPECGVDYQNKVKADAKRARWEATKPNCGFCGGEIPATSRAGSKFCSPRCKGNAHSAIWRQRQGGYMRQYLYGLTPEQYAEMLAEQEGRCAICRIGTPGGRGGWHVDHDHATGMVRGLLCHNCNLALGNFKDDVTRLRAAVAYLEAHSS